MRGYYLGIRDDVDVGDFVVANNIKEAKKLFIEHCKEWLFDYDDWYINMTVKWAKDVNINGLEHGTFSDDLSGEELIKRKIYSTIYETTCPICKMEEVTIYELDDGTICCSDCEEKLNGKVNKE